jgi:Flp pilus assembly secretin CpaC/tetratricopeptide (TPR) repeat protein
MRLYSIPLLIAATVACQSSQPASNSTASTPSMTEAPAAELQAAGPASINSTIPVESSAPASALPQDLQDGQELVRRRTEAGHALAQEYMERAKAELDRADLPSALASSSAAVDVDPNNQEARTLLRKIRGLLGEGYDDEMMAFEDDVQRLQVKRAQARLDAEDHATRGDNHLRAGRYDEAIGAYTQAEMVLRYHPLIATDSLDQQALANKIEEATRLRDEAISQAEEATRLEAERMRSAAELAERNRRETKLREFYDLANKAYLADRFEEAEDWSDLILLEDPGNEAAQSLRRVARESRHFKADEINRRDYREQWLRTFEELDTMNVPQTDSLNFNLARWREVVTRQPLSHDRLDPTGDLERAAIMSRLEEVRFAPNFGGQDDEGTPLESVAGYLQQLTGVNFLISNGVREDLDEDETSVRLHLPDRSVNKVLDLIQETSESLRWKIEDGVVKFITVDEMIGGQVLKTYGVQDLIHPIPDYPGREINVSPSGGLIPPEEDLEEREANVIETGMLEDLIINNVAPESWDADPANSIRITENGIMTVNQTPEVQAQILNLLQQLREATGIMVDIQARFMRVEDTFLEDIGIDLRGLGAPGAGDSNNFNEFGDQSAEDDLNDGPGQDNTVGAFYDEGLDGDIRARVEDLYDTQLGNDEFQGSGGLSFQWTFLNDLQLQLILRAVSKSERVELVTAPRILVHNTARANISILNQVAYVQDFDVEIAQAASIADPIIAVIQDGVILDVRPVVSADRLFITLELRPTVALLKRPIEERVTTLGSQNSVTIMLPEVEIQRVRTSVPLPDGGTVLLGGMKESEKQDKRSGVPILNKIPILSAFFERKGNFISNRKLLILMRAAIVIPEELEPTAPQLGLTE